MHIIKQGILTAVFTMAIQGATSAQAAIYCQGDTECLSKGLSLIKKATKHGCDASALADDLNNSIQDARGFEAQVIADIETCIEKKKYELALAKKQTKRAERINKALGR